MKRKTFTILTCLAIAAGLFMTAASASAHQVPSSDLLLPYFEVDLSGAGQTTFFAVVNSSSSDVRVRMTVYTNWGVELFTTSTILAGEQVRNVNVAEWIVLGRLLDRTLDAGELEHCQAALTGRRSPKDDLYYSTEVDFDKAAGYVRISTEGSPRPDAIFGDYFLVDPAQDFAQGEVLVNVDEPIDCSNLCERHGLRFMLGAGFDEGTQVLMWTGLTGRASTSAYFPEALKTTADILVYKQNGDFVEHRQIALKPMEILTIADLGLGANHGWFDVVTERPSFMAERHSAGKRFSVGLQTFCLPKVTGNPGADPFPGLRIEKSTNGHDADTAPGPTLAVGSAVLWEYVVTNTGNVTLENITVTDDQGVGVSCPQTELEPRRSMTCTAHGTAEAGPYRNVGAVAGEDANGQRVEDDDASHYFGEEPSPPPSSISIEKATNGADADQAPGPEILAGESVSWTYEVTNTGEAKLTQVTVTDDRGVSVSCPRSQLQAGESMTCTGGGTATLGQYKNVGTATAKDPAGETVNDTDPSHYLGKNPTGPPPSIKIEKATNGYDADTAPGPIVTEGDPIHWDYVVINDGEAALNSISVTDDKGVQVSCPKSQLQPGESMTCTGQGTAVGGQYRNVGTVTGRSPLGDEARDTDPSHYYGDDPGTAGISIKKKTNGYDADHAPGPKLKVGQSVAWTYKVSNTGDVRLSNISVTDDKGVHVSCPQSQLDAGDWMVCSGHGTAVEGQYRNTGTVTGRSPQNATVTASDPSHYYGERPGDEADDDGGEEDDDGGEEDDDGGEEDDDGGEEDDDDGNGGDDDDDGNGGDDDDDGNGGDDDDDGNGGDDDDDGNGGDDDDDGNGGDDDDDGNGGDDDDDGNGGDDDDDGNGGDDDDDD